MGDVKCSHLFFNDIAEHGGIPLMWTTGHSVVKAKMHEESAPLAGELSGHFAAASLVVHAVTWALVGAVAGFLWQRGENSASPA